MQRIIATAMLLLLSCCGSSSANSPSSGNCPSDLPATCPANVPSYSAQVAPIVQSVCYECHGPGGQEHSLYPLDTYANVDALHANILAEVQDCLMPPPGASTTLNDNDRVTLLTWLVCNAPNN